jgi:16S rRNA (guanine527-N7)-methyltransferase
MLPRSGRIADLGSGAGVPALILADLGDTWWTLIESQQRRAQWLRSAVVSLGLVDRVEVRWERAEETGRGDLRGVCEAVTARSFGPPGVVAECGSPLLIAGGCLWVSEPPDPDPSRWPEDGLAEVGLERGPNSVTGWLGLIRTAPCPERYPRRVGIPAKRPLF